MEKLKDNRVIYSLNIEDVQSVALEEIGRELSREEMEGIEDIIASNLNWYDAIANAILQKLR